MEKYNCWRCEKTINEKLIKAITDTGDRDYQPVCEKCYIKRKRKTNEN